MSTAQSFAPYAPADPALSGGARHKAALLLYTMPAKDRDWLLAHLSASQRQVLQQLLAELAELGIPADRSLLDDVVGDAALAKATFELPDGADAAALQVLSRLDAAIIAGILRTEPVVLIAHLWLMHHWPWRAAVLDSLGTLKRRQVENNIALLQKNSQALAVTTSPHAPHFQQLHRQLLASLQTRLDLSYPDWRAGRSRVAEIVVPGSGRRPLAGLKSIWQRWGRRS